ncbi:MAG: response regulator transcription factor [Puia sp.]|nr:response regulator transcription factor [Puia sp.]
MVKNLTHKVLLIEDSETVGARLLDLLSTISDIELLGQARSVKTGLEACEETNPDIVFLDINLPDGSGIRLLQDLKSQQPDIHVIMLTNSSDEFYRSKCAELEAAFFLDKTKDFSRIPELVAQIIT